MPPRQNRAFTNNVRPANNFFNDFSGGGPNLAPKPGQPPYCNLPSVSWIIPDGAFSDHPGFSSGDTLSTQTEGGPNWVAKIVDAVGNATCVEYTGPYKNMTPWNDTVIFIVWDDWGGWYDHVMGPALYEDNFLVNGGNQQGSCKPEYQPNGQLWGCGYTYGFRVPFLVVSAYTQPGTVSGFCTQGADCVGNGGNGSQNTDPHRHDFGSILAFVEYNFGLGIGCINGGTTGLDGVQCSNGGGDNFPFADYYAPEVEAGYRPLADFFGQSWRGFTSIPTFNNSFTFDYFYNFNGPFTDPDNDVIDDD